MDLTGLLEYQNLSQLNVCHEDLPSPVQADENEFSANKNELHLWLSRSRAQVLVTQMN